MESVKWDVAGVEEVHVPSPVMIKGKRAISLKISLKCFADDRSSTLIHFKGFTFAEGYRLRWNA